MDTRVSLFFHCTGFEQRPSVNGLPPISVPIELLNNITPPFLPTTFTFAVGIGVVGINLEVTNYLKYSFVSPSNKDVVIQEFPLPIAPNDVNLDADMQGFILSLNMQNVILQDEGYYQSKIHLNNTLIGEYSIKVKAVTQNG